MLCRLNIKNVALIDEAEIEFSNGLNVLSGETGSGKSVILDSINFVLGAKADKSMIRHGADFCLVSCDFTDISQDIKDILREYDIDCDKELIVKRKFDLKGNGYIKINGENVTAAMLKKITVNLVDVHGQSEHFLLLGKAKQLECIDRGAEVGIEKNALKNTISKIKDVEKAILVSGGTPAERAIRVDILKYQIAEIENADLKDGEEDELVCLRNKLLNLEKIYSALSVVCGGIIDDGGSLDGVNIAKQALKNIVAMGAEYDELFNSLSIFADELSELGEKARDLLENLDSENVDLDFIEQRLDVYKSLKKKYGNSLSEIDEFLAKAKEEYDALCSFDERYEALKKELIDLKNVAYSQCVALSDKRRAYAKKFEERVTDKLKQLGMSGAKFGVVFADIRPIGEVSEFLASGLDDVEFYFSANLGEPLKPLSKIISGGEMSRFMLAIKTQAQSVCGTYIFDEIDAGLSGAAAVIVAKNFAEIAVDRQIIAISHLPQISAMSDSSVFIEKIENEGKTFTKIHLLNECEKVFEVVRLIGGNNDDETAKKHAEHLIEEASAYKASLQKTPE